MRSVFRTGTNVPRNAAVTLDRPLPPVATSLGYGSHSYGVDPRDGADPPPSLSEAVKAHREKHPDLGSKTKNSGTKSSDNTKAAVEAYLRKRMEERYEDL